MLPEAGTGNLRLFFALWPTEAEREALWRAVRKTVRASGGRPVARDNLHVTLAFLGPVAAARRAEIETAAGEVRSAAFGLSFARLGYWPRPRLVWVAPEEAPAALVGLYDALWSALERLGFARERRAFRPHITLARKVARPGRMELAGAVSWSCTSFALVHSRTGPDGSRYELLRQWPLGGPVTAEAPVSTQTADE
jgi:2'-5' RNA ligase